MQMEIEKKNAVVFIQKGDGPFFQRWQTVKRAFREFLSVPTFIIIGFLALAMCSNIIDREHSMWLKPVRAFMKTNIFNDVKATSDLLGAIACGIITVTSLTITLLLIVVQQTAASMSSQVFDQFLRSRHNQVYIGFFAQHGL